MAGYIIAQIEITDADTFETYKSQVPATIGKYGGEYLVRGGDMEVLEGEWPLKRIVVIKFPSADVAREWYHSDDYEGPKALRKAASNGNLVVVEGI